MVFVDSNVILGGAMNDTLRSEWSGMHLGNHLDQWRGVINATVYGEIAFPCVRVEDLEEHPPAHLHDYRAIPSAAAFLAEPMAWWSAYLCSP